MSSIPKMTDSNLPEDGLRFFHGLSNWVENVKGLKLKLIEWENGQKELIRLTCFKPKRKEPFSVPSILPKNSLYVPTWIYGLKVIFQLRNAFCHSNLVYDENSKQYVIKLTDKTKIAGQFSLEAIREFVEIYLQPKETKNSK